MFLSVIIPVYNAEKYLCKCIESLLSQTYTNLEIILVDDGSKDDSLSICREYEKADSRVKCFHKENGGLSSARNYGLDRATGEYITFVDSDDVISLDFFSSAVNTMAKTNADIAYGLMTIQGGSRLAELPHKEHRGDIVVLTGSDLDDFRRFLRSSQLRN